MSEITKAEMRQKLGNITQLQELLFGEQTREYNRQLDLYQARLERLESERQKSQFIADKRLAELEKKLLERIDSVANSLEKKIQYFNINDKQEREQIKADLKIVEQQSHDSISYLQDNIETQNSKIKAEIRDSKVALDKEMRLLKQQISEKLNSSLSELSTGKVSHSDLAEVLFEICLKLKDSDTNFKLLNGSQNAIAPKQDLPEQSN